MNYHLDESLQLFVLVGSGPYHSHFYSSRAERDKLVQIIESRVVERQTFEGHAAERLTEISNRNVDSGTDPPIFCKLEF